ncbi:MAG TPA: hypothetical protein VLG49_06970, partial [Rhabdochlamydiaceae bacterium]|nr:hypothetical protein [Rhabdochlamydiaceae bacterium]
MSVSFNQAYGPDRLHNPIRHLEGKNHHGGTLLKVSVVAAAIFGIVSVFSALPVVKAIFAALGILAGTAILLKCMQRCLIENKGNHRHHPHWRWPTYPARSSPGNHDIGFPPYPPSPPSPPRRGIHVPVGSGHVPYPAPRGGHVPVGGGHVPQPVPRGGTHVPVGGGHPPQSVPRGGHVPVNGGHVPVGRGHVPPSSRGGNAHVPVGRGHVP